MTPCACGCTWPPARRECPDCGRPVASGPECEMCLCEHCRCNDPDPEADEEDQV